MRSIYVKPTETTERETEVYLLTILHYVNNEYDSSLQIEFDEQCKLRDYVDQNYVQEGGWERTWGENEFWRTHNKTLHHHIIVIQKLRKHEKITKILEEDNIML